MNVAQAKASARAVGATALGLDDEHYPPLLREIHDPPPVIWVRGDPGVLLLPQLAVVGSRRASAAGLRLAGDLGAELARAGVSVCSGLALGIDAAAHRGSLSVGGTSVAIMATGIDAVYPRRHSGLAAELERSGCLVTEFPPGTPPLRHNFPVRNRIISGMSLGVLVVEAALPSGSLITAVTALEQGREVFAAPWSALHTGGRGCLQLLRDGAKLVTSVEDVLEELAPVFGAQRERTPLPANPQGDVPDSWLLPLVGFELASLDELVQRSGRPPAAVLDEISSLELAGVVVRAPGGFIRA